jgi:hypothetical protein
MQLRLLSFLAQAAAFLPLSLCVAHATSYNFTTIQYPGAAVTTPYGVNNGGEVVGSFAESALGPFHGFTYSAGVYTQLDDPNCNSNTFLMGVNDAGVIVGDCEEIPFVYRKGVFTYINGANTVVPQAVNNHGVIVGWRAVLTPVLSSFILVGDKVLNKSF